MADVAQRSSANVPGLPKAPPGPLRRSSSLAIWTRAVIEPAWRRAGAVWLGSALVTAVMFGPTGITPTELTALALANPSVGLALTAIWLLMFVPIARVIVRADAARYLRTLPGTTLGPIVVAAVALVGMQLPWLALWTIGRGLLGLGVVAATTLAAVLIGAWQPPASRPSTPTWPHPRRALQAIYLRALRRRAGDAIVRGVGLAILAGMAAGLLVHNNKLTGSSAAVLGSGVIAVMLVPSTLGLLTALVEAYRTTTWLAASLGIAHVTRITTLAVAASVVFAIAGAIAITAAAVVVGADLTTLLWLAIIGELIAIACAVCVTRGLIRAERSHVTAQQTVVSAIATAGIAVIWLGLLGIAGVAGMAATAILAVSTVKVIE